jgi:CheY-like chemotaxis protein
MNLSGQSRGSPMKIEPQTKHCSFVTSINNGDYITPSEALGNLKLETKKLIYEKITLASRPNFARQTQANSSTKMLADYVASKGRKTQFLVVDDSQVNRMIATQMLREFDITIDIAANGIEAVAAAQIVHYDLILMDLQMPEMDGIKATRIICSQDLWKTSIPIVAVTSNAFPDDIASCIAAGMVGFIPKPVRKNLMIEEIVRVLSRSEGGARTNTN